jgi:lipopolysaccharide biosynthesis protein
MVAIILHLYYQDLWDDFKNKLLPIIDDNIHLFVTTNSDTDVTADVRKYAKKVYIVENNGMDFGPFINVYNKIKNDGYDYFLKIHTKKSKHNKKLGDVWREKLTEVFFNSKEGFNTIIEAMKVDDSIYMAGAYSCFYDRTKEPLGSVSLLDNKETIKIVNSFLNVEAHGCFFAGSIFMVSNKYLDMLFKNVILDEFESIFNHTYNSSTSTSHAMERLIGYGVEYYNGKFLIIN